jgi:hypothetical protein
MLIPDSFIFTQQNLQNYVDCNRRFYLLEVARLDWPAIESEPVREQEALIALGSKFHLLCQQYFNGIPVSDLQAQISDPDLETWWINFLKLGLSQQDPKLLPEKYLSIPFAGYRLAAKYDLILTNPDNSLVIYDWKTSKHQPNRKYMLDKMQSRVYPFVLTSLRTASTDFDPGTISMIYWYPEFPRTPIKFEYSQSQFLEDSEYISSLFEEITEKNEGDFKLTDDHKKCDFCRYRSLCNRGISAGVNPSEESLPTANPFDFDLNEP